MILWGCGLFDTRDPRPPVTPTAPCATYTAPDSLLSNIRVHYGEASVASCYNPMLDPNFRFYPDPTDSINNPTSFNGDWFRNVEEVVATNIAADSIASFQVFFDSTYQSTTFDPGPPQRETRFYSYHLLVTRIGQFAPVRYQGRAEITFQQEAGTLWRILYWIDHSDGSIYPTWTRLRGDHRVGV